MLTFGEALANIQQEQRMTRKGWNGANQCIFLVEMDFYELLDDKIPEFVRGIDWNLSPWVALKTAQGKIVPWLPSQSDMLAEDWVVYSD